MEKEIIFITFGGGGKIVRKISTELACSEESFAPKRSEASEEPDCFPPSILSPLSLSLKSWYQNGILY